MNTRTPRQLWLCEPAEDMGELAETIRRYLAMPGARTMGRHQAAQVEAHLTPLERALTPRAR